jgi:transposase
MQGRKQYQEKLFTSFQLSDRVPADNLYRKITELIDFQFLYPGTKQYYGDEGQASIDPVVFFKLMLVGYLENLCSDRRIIQTSSMRMDVLFFLGYDIDEPLPWHSTLSRTRQLYGEDIFQELFRQVLKQCIDKGMVSGRGQAVDSVLIKANASMESLLEKEILDDVATYSKELNEDQDNVISLKPGGEKGKGRNNKTHYSPADSDARISTKPGKPFNLNYLGQLSVDTESHIITHAQAFPADKKDSQCLAEVVNNTIKNLSESNLEVEQVLADGNYSSAEALEWLESIGITGYIPNFGPYKPTREGFTYEAEHDRYVCASGKYLLFKGLKKHHGINKQYRSSSTDCKACPMKMSCIGATNYKTITESLSKPLFDKMEKRVKSRHGFKMKKLRQSTVEPVIGTLVNFLGLKRINTKGLSKATKCVTIAAIAYNLKKLVRFYRNHPAKPVEMPLLREPNNLSDRVKNFFFSVKIELSLPKVIFQPIS